MKWLLILTVLGGIASSSAQSSPSGSTNPVQAYSGTIWTTITFQLADGRTSAATRRTEVSRDSAGNSRTEMHRLTKGLDQDISAPVDRVFTGISRSELPTYGLSSGETLIDDQDLGTRNFAGLPAMGRLRTFDSVNLNPRATRRSETWFSPVLSMFVHIETREFDGTTIVSDLSNLRLDTTVTSGGVISAPTAPAISQIHLYRALFHFVSQMERDRLANPPTPHADMVEIEDRLRKKINLSPSEWQTLVNASVKVDSYAAEALKQAHAMAHEDRMNAANIPNARRAKLQQMQSDLNDRVLGDIKDLETSVGTESTSKIHAYLNGPLAASAQVTHRTAPKKVTQ